MWSKYLLLFLFLRISNLNSWRWTWTSPHRTITIHYHPLQSFITIIYYLTLDLFYTFCSNNFPPKRKTCTREVFELFGVKTCPLEASCFFRLIGSLEGIIPSVAPPHPFDKGHDPIKDISFSLQRRCGTGKSSSRTSSAVLPMTTTRRE